MGAKDALGLPGRVVPPSFGSAPLDAGMALVYSAPFGGQPLLRAPSYDGGQRGPPSNGGPHDLEHLKARILEARQPGEITAAIAASTFGPRINAFTSLINMVSWGEF